MSTGSSFRVRFSPSPTGTPHVGLIRTALFNWAFARHHGGTFVLRIEDTDASRDSEESYSQLLDAMRWLGLDWDEGIEVGGPNGPYRQSQRMDIYTDVIDKLVQSGHAYESFSTPEEVEARHVAAGRDPKLGYDGFDRDLSDEQIQAFREQGREPVLRLRMPDEDIVVNDLIRGEVTFAAGTVPDFALVRANGKPLYTLVNPVDDALMGITHVIRGEDLLSSTPRQVALWRALSDIGLATGEPTYAHLPLVRGDGNKKLSKRDPESNLFAYRERGFIREGLLNYLALLGWAIAPDRDIFTPEELIEAFEISQVNPNPARFDVKKAEAINATHLRMLEQADFASRVVPYLHDAGLVSATDIEDLTPRERELLLASAPLIQERMNTLDESVGMLAFLYTDTADLVHEPESVAALRPEAGEVLTKSIEVLSTLESFEPEALQAALREVLVDEMGIKPRFAFAPLRVALTGRRVSPPLFESMEILGKDETLTRLRNLIPVVGD